MSNFIVINWFTWMCVINSTGYSVLPYIFGVLVIGAVISVTADRLDASDLDWQGLLCISAAGMSLTFPFIWETGSSRYYSGGTSVTSSTLISSLALGVYLVYRVIRRRRGDGFAVFLFCALLARWYFDLFFTFMSKSLFFVGGGVVLLLMAFAYRKWNKTRDAQNSGIEGGTGDDTD
jgi:uncharacterized membrane protein